MLTFTYYQDSGHGWVAVKRDLLISMGIFHKVSTCSYQKGKTVYLEEDCDLPLLLNALDKNSIPYTLLNKHCTGNSPIRSYQYFNTREE